MHAAVSYKYTFLISPVVLNLFMRKKIGMVHFVILSMMTARPQYITHEHMNEGPFSHNITK